MAGVGALMAEVRGCSGPRATVATSRLPLGLGPLSAGWRRGLLREMYTQILLVTWEDACGLGGVLGEAVGSEALPGARCSGAALGEHLGTAESQPHL